MPRTRTGRTPNDHVRRHTNGGVTSIPVAMRTPASPPYLRDSRWATAVRRRADVFVVDISDRFRAGPNASEDELLPLSA